MNWDDLRFFLALRRHGTLSEAARALGVNHSTVGRRIQSLETTVGGPLFEKGADGWRLTALGQTLATASEKLDDHFVEVERAIHAADRNLAGTVRLTTSQFLDRFMVLPAAQALRDAHPEVVLEVYEDVKLASLPKHEADLALRFLRRGTTAGSQSDYITRLGTFGWSLYGRVDVVEKHGLRREALDLRGVPVVSYNEAAVDNPAADFIVGKAGGNPNIVLALSTMYGVVEAIVQGLGVGVLPNRFASAGLVRLSDDLLVMDAWLAVHEDMRANARVRAVWEVFLAWAQSNPDAFF